MKQAVSLRIQGHDGSHGKGKLHVEYVKSVAIWVAVIIHIHSCLPPNTSLLSTLLRPHNSLQFSYQMTSTVCPLLIVSSFCALKILLRLNTN